MRELVARCRAILADRRRRHPIFEQRHPIIPGLGSARPTPASADSLRRRTAACRDRHQLTAAAQPPLPRGARIGQHTIGIPRRPSPPLPRSKTRARCVCDGSTSGGRHSSTFRERNTRHEIKDSGRSSNINRGGDAAFDEKRWLPRIRNRVRRVGGGSREPADQSGPLDHGRGMAAPRRSCRPAAVR